MRCSTRARTKEAREQVANPLIEDGQKLIPSVTRVFSRSRDLYIYLQAYERDAATMHPLAAVVTFLKGERSVFRIAGVHGDRRHGSEIEGGAVQAHASAWDRSAAASIVFQITVLDPTAQKAAFWQAPIKIVP